MKSESCYKYAGKVVMMRNEEEHERGMEKGWKI